MSLDEAALREWVHRVAHGMADRRTFLRAMIGLGLSGPCLGNLLATYRPAQAQTTQPITHVGLIVLHKNQPSIHQIYFVKISRLFFSQNFQNQLLKH